MTTKHLPSCLLAGAVLLGAVSPAHAMLPLGEGAEAFVTLKTGIEYNDNLFLSSANEESDTIYRLTPGIEFLFGQNSLAQSKFSYTEEFKFYSDNSSADRELSTVDYSTAYDDGKLAVDLKAGFQQLDQVTRDIRGAGAVRRDVLNAGVNGEVGVTEKTSVRLGIEYNDTDYKRTGFSDWEWLKIPISYYYEVAPKLDASFGYTYKDNTLATALDTAEHFYNVGARGEITPKLTGEIKIGYRESKPEVGASRDTIGVESNFTYTYSEKTTFDFGVSNDFGFSGTGDSYRNLGLNVGLTAAVSDQLQILARLNYSQYDYSTTGQEDDFVSGTLGLTYRFNENLSLSGGYSYTDNNSNRAASDFTANAFNLALSLRY